MQISPGTYLIETITTKFPLVPLIIHNLKTNYADDGIMWFDLDSQMFLSLSMSHLPFCPLWTCFFLPPFHPFYPSSSQIITFVSFSMRPAFVFLSSALSLFPLLFILFTFPVNQGSDSSFKMEIPTAAPFSFGKQFLWQIAKLLVFALTKLSHK